MRALLAGNDNRVGFRKTRLYFSASPITACRIAFTS